MSINITDITIDNNFKKSLEHAYTIPKVPKNYGILLDIYGLKQTAEVGKVNIPRPISVNLRGTLKWDVWKKWENKKPIEAKALVTKIIEDWKEDN